MKKKVIAIDGPSGSGKSTIAKSVADKLGLIYLDTGAMFRSIAYFLDLKSVEPEDSAKIKEQLSQMQLEYSPSDDILINLDGENLTEKIREHYVSGLASKYSQNTEVRNYLKDFQRELTRKRAAVLEGRDIGTVIFPDAALKIFLTADPLVRAKRRFEQLIELGQDSSHINLESITEDIVKRDQADSERELAPLTCAEDAIQIDTSKLNITEVEQKIIELFNERKNLFE